MFPTDHMADSPATEPAKETYDSRAHRTLNAIAQDGQQRLAEIEKQVNQLYGERDAIAAVLQRITPSQPQPASTSNYGGPLHAVIQNVRPSW